MFDNSNAAQLGVGLGFDATLGLIASDNKCTAAVDDALFLVESATDLATLIGPINAGNVLGLAGRDPSGRAVCTLHNGSDVNPHGLACMTGLAIGQVWQIPVDLPTVGDHISVVAFSLGGPIPVLRLFIGEMLYYPPIPVMDVGRGLPTILIADDVSLLGRSLCTLAASVDLGSTQIQLQNAIQIRVGSS